MATTPGYGWPYQALADPPNGAALGEDLALAVEATVQANAATAAAASTALDTRLDVIEGAWPTWVPTLTNLTLGSGQQTAHYRQVGKTVDYYWQFIYGAGSAVGTTPSFTLPVTQAAHYALSTNAGFPGMVYLLDASGGDRQGAVKILSGSTLFIIFWNATPANASITSAAPWTWTTNDSITVSGTYEAA